MTDPVDLLALARETLAQDKKATAGPWRVVKGYWPDRGEYAMVFHEQGPKHSSRAQDHSVCHAGDRRLDAEFIAHARTAAPLLAAEVVRLHEAIGTLPSPHGLVGFSDKGNWKTVRACMWCKAEWPFETPHPANGCLALLVKQHVAK